MALLRVDLSTSGCASISLKGRLVKDESFLVKPPVMDAAMRLNGDAWELFSIPIACMFSSERRRPYPATTRQLCVLATSQTGAPAARPRSLTAAGVRWASQGPTRT